MLSFAASIAPNILLWTLLLVGWAIWRTCRRQSVASGLVAAFAIAALWILSTRPVAESLIAPLERRYPQPAIDALVESGLEQVVVLTAGGFAGDSASYSSTLPPSSAYRFMAGLELCRQIGSNCLLIFSGSAGRSSRDLTAAASMERLARRLAPDGDYRSESRSGSTAEHPDNIEPLLRVGPFALVTSGFHMPRAMRSFERRGLTPVAFPTDLQARGGYRWHDWLPSARNLTLTSLAAREYLASLLYTLRRW